MPRWRRKPARLGRRTNALSACAVQRSDRPAEPVPLHLLPHHRRFFHRAVLRDAVRPRHHRPPAHQAGQGPADPRGRPPDASRQEGHADHGRPDDSLRGARFRPVVVQLGERLRLGRARRHPRLRRHRLLRRLSQSDAAEVRWLRRQAALGCRDPRRRRRHRAVHVAHPVAAQRHHCRAVFQGTC